MFDVLISSIGGVGSTSCAPPDINIDRAIFMVGNPYNAVLSLCRRKLLYRHMINRGIKNGEHFKKCEDLNKFLKNGDPFKMHEQVVNWYFNETTYPVLIVRIEKMKEHKKQICDYLEIPNKHIDDYEWDHKRESDYTKSEYRELLEETYFNVWWLING
jgi:hypothetical protein